MRRGIVAVACLGLVAGCAAVPKAITEAAAPGPTREVVQACTELAEFFTDAASGLRFYQGDLMDRLRRVLELARLAQDAELIGAAEAAVEGLRDSFASGSGDAEVGRAVDALLAAESRCADLGYVS